MAGHVNSPIHPFPLNADKELHNSSRIALKNMHAIWLRRTLLSAYV